MSKRTTPTAEELALRTLPHSLDAERAVLGAILVNPPALERAHNILRPTDFFRRAHRDIFAAMIALVDDQRGAIDLLTVTNELKRRGQLDESGGPAYISALTEGVPRSANVTHHAAIVREHAARRRIIDAANVMLVDAYDAEKPARELIIEADKAVLDLQRGAEPGRLVDVRETSAALYADLEVRAANPGALTGIDTGFKSINDVTFGWQPTDMIVLAARPSIGKTAFILNAAITAARLDKIVGIFSLEMRLKQLQSRMLASIADVWLQRILGGFVNDEELARLGEGMAALERLPIFIDDRGGQRIGDIRAACRRQRAEHGLDLVIIDYVQLIPGSLDRRGGTRNEEVTDISRRVKALADEVQAPVLLLSQLSRAGEKEGRRPQLSDLRESGSLEQDADVVVFLHRKHHLQGGTTNVIIEKQRNGPGGTFDVTFTRETQTFTDGAATPELPLDSEPEEKKRRPPRGWRRNR